MGKTWSVAEAKSQLSEIMRRAREEGPQRIGKRQTYVLLTEGEWERARPEPVHLGKWLVDNAPRAQLDDPPLEIIRICDRVPPTFDEVDQ